MFSKAATLAKLARRAYAPERVGNLVLTPVVIRAWVAGKPRDRSDERTCSARPLPWPSWRDGRMHQNGWETWYLHLSSFAPGLQGNPVTEATSVHVQQGRYLGQVGATGVCT